MRLARRMDFRDFVSDTGFGFVIALIIMLFVLLLGAAVISDEISSRWTENNIYLALGEEEVNDEAAIETAKLIKSLYYGQTFDVEKIRKIEKIWDQTDSYFRITIKHWDNVKLILDGRPEAAEIKVKILTWKWFFVIMGKTAWIITALCMSISYVLCFSEHEGRNRGESVLTYPWNKAWAWPLVTVMFPYLIISQPILLNRYAIFRIRRLRRAEEIEVSQPTPVISQEDIEKRRIALRRTATLIEGNVGLHRQNWIAICGQRLLREKKKIESDIRSHRLRLSELGQMIENSQRGLAEAQSALKTLQRAIENRGTDTEEFAREFDKLTQEIPLVAAVEIVNGEIRVHTDTIFIFYQGKKYEIGDFLIRIKTEENDIRIENLCNTSSSGRHHPYSFPPDSNRFCFGSLSSYVNQLLIQKDYLSLIIVILQALQSAEGDRPGDVRLWKEVRNEGQKKPFFTRWF